MIQALVLARPAEARAAAARLAEEAASARGTSSLEAALAEAGVVA
jgi:hypothetical protein